ncbi:hypothetical protein L5I01_23395 [Gordonia sp. HY442]|uniref:hypothetical protein n=1 Tax=Gordonia zhenghanii TaxID=2911516 RepID=UPI001F161F02|nr:hypothetical protein [Gordonia zhenghanii]MCF8606304.1 hypothetical protein [Gordonia zhenghanii]
MRRIKLASAAVAAVGACVLLIGCGADDSSGGDASSVATVTSAIAKSSTTKPRQTPSPTVAPETTEAVPETTAPANVVAEGAACGPRGATAVLSDGSTAYCARLVGTDGAAWSREPNLAPNPALADSGVYAGAPCHGYQTGSFAYDASGTQLVCNNYTWEQNVGQKPGTKWGDGQREWAKCMETKTQDECREQMNE